MWRQRPLQLSARVLVLSNAGVKRAPPQVAAGGDNRSNRPVRSLQAYQELLEGKCKCGCGSSWALDLIPPSSTFIHGSRQSARPNYPPPTHTQGKLLPYRPAVLLQHSSDKVPTTLLFLLLRGFGISMSIKADLVLGIFSHTPPSRPYRRSFITA